MSECDYISNSNDFQLARGVHPLTRQIGQNRQKHHFSKDLTSSSKVNIKVIQFLKVRTLHKEQNNTTETLIPQRKHSILQCLLLLSQIQQQTSGDRMHLLMSCMNYYGQIWGTQINSSGKAASYSLGLLLLFLYMSRVGLIWIRNRNIYKIHYWGEAQGPSNGDRHIL